MDVIDILMRLTETIALERDALTGDIYCPYCMSTIKDSSLLTLGEHDVSCPWRQAKKVIGRQEESTKETDV